MVKIAISCQYCIYTPNMVPLSNGGDEMINYAPLWETMRKKGVTQYRLIKHYRISAAQINRMKKNMSVSAHTLEAFCKILDCRVEDVIEIRNE